MVVVCHFATMAAELLHEEADSSFTDLGKELNPTPWHHNAEIRESTWHRNGLLLLSGNWLPYTATAQWQTSLVLAFCHWSCSDGGLHCYCEVVCLWVVGIRNVPEITGFPRTGFSGC